MGHKRSYSYSSDSSAYAEYLKSEIVKLMKNRKKRRGTHQGGMTRDRLIAVLVADQLLGRAHLLLATVST